jgi:nitrate/nitrite-specific signal transduction histidine kinase
MNLADDFRRADHAGAQVVRVGLHSTPKSDERTGVHIEVADDGIGFDPALLRPGHYGRRGIHEQAAQIGANPGVFSVPGKGTQVLLAFYT